MKRIALCAVLALCMALTACRGTDVINQPAVQPTATQSVKNQYCVIFWPDLNGEKLVSSTELISSNASSVIEFVAKKFSETPPKYCSPILHSGATVTSVRKVESLVTVDLSQEFMTNMDERDRFSAIHAMVNTLTNLRGVEYVEIKVAGESVKLGNRPFGALSRFYGDIDTSFDTYLRAKEAQNTPDTLSEKFNVVLYFLSNNKKYVIPEVRSITVRNGDYIRTVINELNSGPAGDGHLTPLFTTPMLLGSENIRTEEMGNCIRLLLQLRTDSVAQLSDKVVLSGVYHSLAPFVEGMEQISIFYSDSHTMTTQNVLVIEELIAGTEGEYVNLYLPGKTANTLAAVKHATAVDTPNIEQYQAATVVYSYVHTLYQQLQNTLMDENAVSNAYRQSILDIVYRGEIWDEVRVSILHSTATIDVNDTMYCILKGMPDDQEKMLVYSLVNTLTDDPEITSVRFTLNGQPITAGDTVVDFSGELFRNPGVIEKEN